MKTYFNPIETVYRQYAGSPKLKALIGLFGQELDPAPTIQRFYDEVFNIQTAGAYGLNIWGKILNLSRVMSYQPTVQWFGFREADLSTPTQTDPQPFGSAPFVAADVTQGGSLVLADEDYRKALMMRAMANITDCTIPSLNRMLMYLFSDSGYAWVTTDGPMQMSYHFAFTPSSSELALIQNSNILPKPAGCQVSYVLEGVNK